MHFNKHFGAKSILVSNSMSFAAFRFLPSPYALFKIHIVWEHV